MEIRRLGEAIFRLRLSPLTSFILPSLSPATWYTAPSMSSRRCRPAFTPPHSRSISTKEPIYQRQPASTNDPPTKPGSTPARNNFDDDLISLLNLPPKLDPRKPGTRPAAPEHKPESSAADIMAHYHDYNSPSRIPTDRMLTPSPSTTDNLNPNISSSRSLLNTPTPAASPPPMPTMRLNASTGRSVAVNKNRGIDFARALRNLELLCRQNNVRVDFMRQRFHERPGLKRKRLKSMRWRRRFMTGFKGMVAKVDEMRKKGW
jgi:small subunit ribosomal protein MRP21